MSTGLAIGVSRFLGRNAVRMAITSGGKKVWDELVVKRRDECASIYGDSWATKNMPKILTTWAVVKLSETRRMDFLNDISEHSGIPKSDASLLNNFQTACMIVAIESDHLSGDHLKSIGPDIGWKEGGDE